MARLKIKRRVLQRDVVLTLRQLFGTISHAALVLDLPYETPTQKLELNAALRGDDLAIDLFDRIMRNWDEWCFRFCRSLLQAGWGDSTVNRVRLSFFDVPKFSDQPWPDWAILAEDHPRRLAAHRHLAEDYELLEELRPDGRPLDLAAYYRYQAKSAEEQHVHDELERQSTELQELLNTLTPE